MLSRRHPALLLILAFTLGCSDSETPDPADPREGGETGGCLDNEDCTDDNPCTTDVCGEGNACVHLPEAGVSCDDADACTAEDICDELGQCAGTLLPGVPDDPCRTCT